MSDIGDSAEKGPHSGYMPLTAAFARAWQTPPSEDPLYYIISDAVERISNAKTSDVQEIARSQIQLLLGYYQLALDQAKRSFNWALIAAGIGLAFFLAAVGFVLYWNSGSAATISVVSGSMVEAIAGINFYLYSKTSGHLADFHNRLEGTQRYLLANSICESLDEPNKQAARIELVRAIAQISLPDTPPKAFAATEKG
jgi:hypothetical protein